MPQTLLQVAGASLQPGRASDSVLIPIDHQLEYLTGCLPLPGIEAARAQIARLLERARSAGMPVIHVVQHGRPGGRICNPEGPYVGIIPGLEPAAGEPTVVKSLPSSFARTNLAELIEATGRKSLVFCGFMTHMCVSTTVRAALDLGYRSTVVAAACGSRDLPDPLGGGVIPAETVHRTALAELADRFAAILPDAEALER